jgi:nucleoside-diphosphate-sugar epimerase
MKTLVELENKLTEPTPALIEDLRGLDGDILILGVGGKMGPSLAKLAKRAITEGNLNKRVIGVSRFSSGTLREELEAAGIETISADLLDPDAVAALPDVKNVIHMVGYKFGTSSNAHMTWAMNTLVAGQVARKYRNSRIVAFSSGNIYPFTPVRQGGADENVEPQPVGEYAQSCLGRERLFDYFSKTYQTPVLHYRLNYAIDLRYGVLVDIARLVKEGKPVDLTMGNVNCIWQGDANTYALRALTKCQAPAKILNVTGPETISVRWAAEQFAKRFGTTVTFVGEEGHEALLNNASQAHRLFGYPRVGLAQMMEWVVDWIESGGALLDKPTGFQETEGKF